MHLALSLHVNAGHRMEGLDIRAHCLPVQSGFVGIFRLRTTSLLSCSSPLTIIYMIMAVISPDISSTLTVDWSIMSGIYHLVFLEMYLNLLQVHFQKFFKRIKISSHM